MTVLRKAKMENKIQIRNEKFDRYFTETTEPMPRPDPVIILTYARSGSTFLGDIIRLDETVFYFFEPLHFMMTIQNKTLHYYDAPTRYNCSFLNEAENIITDIVSCQFLKLPIEFWTGTFAPIQGHQYRNFLITNFGLLKMRYSERDKMKSAIQQLQTECFRAKKIAIKTIRTPLFILQNLFKNYQNLKIVHLIRDPRPTIKSQSTYINRISSVSKYARNLCARIYNDVIISDILSSGSPGKIVRIRYENMALYPLHAAKYIYNFLHLNFSAKVSESIRNMTSSGKTEAGPLSTQKANSTEIVYKWRLKNSITFVIQVDNECTTLYNKVGYVPVTSLAMLKNLSIPLFYETDNVFEFGDEIPLH